MSTLLPGRPLPKYHYILRALLAGLLILGFATYMVSRSTGVLSTNPVVYAEIPVEAGLITSSAPVRYMGVKVGEISSIDAGTSSSRVNLEIDQNAIDSIPGNVEVRVLPRTFFGDIYIQLLAPQTDRAPAGPLRDGEQVNVDRSPDAVNIYDIYSRFAKMLAETQPEQLSIALAAVDSAIGDRGDELGTMVDDLWHASQELDTAIDDFIEATPEFRRVVESLREATPDVIETMNSVTSLSAGIVEHQNSLRDFIAGAAGYLDVAVPFLSDQQANIITVIDATGTIMSTVADNPAGLSGTLREADLFGAAGAIVFNGGRFNITAVPTFSQPMPYTAKDCPRYGTMRGAQCFGTGSALGVGPVREPGEPNRPLLPGPNYEQERAAEHAQEDAGRPTATPASHGAVIDGDAEAAVLARLEAAALGEEEAAERPNIATTMMLGPMVRGSEVHLS